MTKLTSVMKEYFLRLYQYNHWANQRYMELFLSSETIPEKVQLLASHILTAQSNWLDRIQGIKREPLPIWTMMELGKLQQMAEENNNRWIEFLESLEESELERIVSYHNMQGLPYETKVSDIAAHVANHGTYHRAQFAWLLREAEIKPPNTDFITYTRIISNQKVKDWSDK
jgi:uncharacterized damage-inducible protein DinB